MQILNFVPLLIWSLAFPWMSSAHKRDMLALGHKYDTSEDTVLYLFGCGFWFIVGIFNI